MLDAVTTACIMTTAWLLIGHHSTRAGSEGCTGSFSSVCGQSQGVGGFADAWQINVDAACSPHHLQPAIFETLSNLAASSENQLLKSGTKGGPAPGGHVMVCM